MYLKQLSTLEKTDENKIFFVRSPQAFWQSSAPGALSILLTSANNKIYRSPKAEVISIYFVWQMAGYNCEWQVGYTTAMIKMLIAHRNIKSIPEFKTKILSGVELKSLWHFYGLHLQLMEQRVGYILHFGFLSSTLFVSEKILMLETFMSLNLSFISKYQALLRHFVGYRLFNKQAWKYFWNALSWWSLSIAKLYNSSCTHYYKN